jgi:hypothetical protein
MKTTIAWLIMLSIISVVFVLFVMTLVRGCSKKEAPVPVLVEQSDNMDFTITDTVRAQTVIDTQGIVVIGFCWQDRPFLVASKTGFGGDGLQLLRVEGWCQ